MAKRKKHIYFFIGVTGELIKHAPIIKEFQKRNIPFKIITSGQGNIHFQELDGYIGTLKADIALPIKSNKSSAVMFLFWAIKLLFMAPFWLRKELRGKIREDTYFIVHGDPISSMIGAILAKLVFRIKLIHNESGCSSYNILVPFPEEISRNVIWRLADVLTPQSNWALSNLKGISAKKVVTPHNTLIETYFWATRTPGFPKEIKKLGKYYYLFMHRQEHVIFRKEYSKQMIEFIIKNADPTLKCVLLSNYLTTSVIESLSNDWDENIKKRIFIAPRFAYTDFMKMLSQAEFMATDSATNQVESSYMGVPYLGLRNQTDNIEGMNENVVLAKDNKRVIRNFLKQYKKYRRAEVKMKQRPSKTIVDFLVKHEGF